MLLIYSNTPNPIIFERLYALNNVLKINSSLKYIRRKNSPISLHMSNERCICAFEADDSMNKVFGKFSSIIKMVMSLRISAEENIYAFYPDMLMSALIYKFIFKRKCDIYYEIQDLHEVNIIFRFIHNLMMLPCKAIFLTSPNFKDDLVIKKLENKSFFISNAPFIECWQTALLDKVITPEHIVPTIGFIGMLRDEEQLIMIEKLSQLRGINVLVAGTTLFKSRLDRIAESADNVVLYGAYDQETLYQEIYPKIDIVWAVYPKTRNYSRHIARRFMEAIVFNKKVVIASHAFGMLSYQQELGEQLYILEDEKSSQAEAFLRWAKKSIPVKTSHSFAKFSTYVAEFSKGLATSCQKLEIENVK